MRQSKIDAIVLRRTRFGESSLIVNIFSRQSGRVDAIAKGCLRPKSPFNGHLEPFQREEMLLIERPLAGTDLLIDAWLESDHTGLRLNPIAFAAAGLLAEITLNGCMVNDPHPELFDRLALAFACLSSLGHPESLIHHELKRPGKGIDATRQCLAITGQTVLGMLADLGFALSLTECASCGDELKGRMRLSVGSGGILCGKCAGSRAKLNPAALADLRDWSQGRPGADARHDTPLLHMLASYVDRILERRLESTRVLLALAGR